MNFSSKSSREARIQTATAAELIIPAKPATTNKLKEAEFTVTFMLSQPQFQHMSELTQVRMLHLSLLIGSLPSCKASAQN